MARGSGSCEGGQARPRGERPSAQAAAAALDEEVVSLEASIADARRRGKGQLAVAYEHQLSDLIASPIYRYRQRVAATDPSAPLSAARAQLVSLEAAIADARARGKSKLAIAYEHQRDDLMPLPFYCSADDWIEPLFEALDYAHVTSRQVSRERFIERADEPNLPPDEPGTTYWELEGANLLWVSLGDKEFFYCTPDTVERVQRMGEEDLPYEFADDALNF